MVWDGTCLGARIELVIIDGGDLTAERYIRNILQEHIVPSAPHIGEHFVHMQDNARLDIAHGIKDYLNEAGVPWPACSSYLNPEHVWDMLGRRLKLIILAFQNCTYIRAALIEE